VGFHTTEYKRNFLACLEYEELRTRAHIQANPISVDYEYYRNAASQLQSRSFANVWRSKAKTPILIIGVDRQDYTKGIPQKIKALELLFSRNPKWRGRLTFIQVMNPSREEIEAYDEVKRETYQSVYELNSRFGKKDYLPVQLIYRSLDFYELMGLYLAGDIALVTPIKDGLNLVAKEYITCHLGKEGVLVLSKGAGAAAELKDAVLVDASDTQSIAEGIEKALTMSSAEKRKRFANLKKEVQQHDLFHWRNIFLGKAITAPASIFRAKS
jgi:trehalose-6-phosphate synthase